LLVLANISVNLVVIHFVLFCFILVCYINMVKIFTMVKGENDIVKDWVLYHGSIFGYKNIYVIDNFSRDGTYETLVNLKNKYEINVCRLPDYKKKGVYMSTLIKTFSKNEFVFPIDIDEFIVCYDKTSNQISCDNETIYNNLKILTPNPCYKMNYINPKILKENGYNRATIESSHGSYSDYGNQAKTFFYSSLFNGNLDHGNHYNTNNYFLSNFCLVHYHARNLEQMKKKVYNNVSGLGYNPFDISKLIEYSKIGCNGIHHVNHQISILQNTYKIPITVLEPTDIILEPISKKLLSLNL